MFFILFFIIRYPPQHLPPHGGGGGGGGGYPHGYMNPGYYMPNGGVMPQMGGYRGNSGGSDPRYSYGAGGAGMDWPRDARMLDGYAPVDNVYSRRKGNTGNAGNGNLPGSVNVGTIGGGGNGVDGYDRRSCP